jgi:hypothetical protein
VSSAPPESESATGQQTGCYVYGILPSDVELVDDITGVGDREVKLVRSDALAALASEVDLVGPIYLKGSGHRDYIWVGKDTFDGVQSRRCHEFQPFSLGFRP